MLLAVDRLVFMEVIFVSCKRNNYDRKRIEVACLWRIVKPFLVDRGVGSTKAGLYALKLGAMRGAIMLPTQASSTTHPASTRNERF